ncbi:MAG: DUF4124 domain-containing protein [Rubrivivax sp.]|nr:MAG: DUF4124 domain-containing protein [Rubrivivax sp.]
MKVAVVGLSLGLVVCSAQAQQVWRCESDGQVIYTDQPCEKAGNVLPGSQLKVNVADTAGAAAAGALTPASGVLEREYSPAQPAATADVLTSAPAARVPVRHARRDAYMSRVAMQGLMDTDFVLRGYMLRRQPQAITQTP